MSGIGVIGVSNLTRQAKTQGQQRVRYRRWFQLAEETQRQHRGRSCLRRPSTYFLVIFCKMSVAESGASGRAFGRLLCNFDLVAGLAATVAPFGLDPLLLFLLCGNEADLANGGPFGMPFLFDGW